MDGERFWIEFVATELRRLVDEKQVALVMRGAARRSVLRRWIGNWIPGVI